MGAAREAGFEEVQRFARCCTAFLTDGSEVSIGAIQGVCRYSIEQVGVQLTVLNPALEEAFMKAARRFRKPGTLRREMKEGHIIITFRIRRG